MQITKNEINKSEVELTIEIQSDEYDKFLKKAATRLSQKTTIPGFRVGHVPYEQMVRKYGLSGIMEEAINEIVSHFFWQAVEREQLKALGQPEIAMEKMAPGNPLIFKAKVALVPEVKLGNYADVVYKKQVVEIDKQEADKVINDLLSMQAKEAAVNRSVKPGDKVEINFDIKLNKVTIEGGSSTKYPFVVGKKQMLPEFEKAVVGLKKGEKKQFDLKFPENYHGKHIAGKVCQATVEVLEVFERTLPELTDDWAKSLGATGLVDLKKKIEDNLKHEKGHQAEQKAETEMLSEIVNQATFGEIPEVLMNNETDRMVHELKHSVGRQGIKFEDYLSQIKKTEKELKKEFTGKALERIKTSLVINEIAKAEKIEVSQSEVKAELDKQLATVQDPKLKEQYSNQSYKDYLKIILRNQKTIIKLKEKLKN